MIEAQKLTKRYRVRKGFFSTQSQELYAVRSVDLTIKEGEIVGLVGESGSGKSTLARLLLGLEPPTKGQVTFYGRPLWSRDRRGVSGKGVPRRFRRKAQMIFQDPVSSLNPKKTVGQTLEEPLKIHGIAKGREATQEAERLLKEAGLEPRHINSYPHELSGGQKQRGGIARALATSPSFIVADEPTSALDVSIQAQIINLLLDLHDRYGLTMLFISHAIPLVEFVSQRIAVMYQGAIVEVFRPGDQPVHPYTRLLLEAVPG